MDAHTPGPWQVSPLDGRTCGPSRLLIQSGTTIPQMQAVAIITLRNGETNANARLVAAAPELLAACKHVLACGCVLEGETAYELLQAAIAKAEGAQ